jgi:hypothetical protein
MPNKSSVAQQPASSTPKDEAVSAPTVTLTAQEKKIKSRRLELQQELVELKQELAELAQKKALQAHKAVTVGMGANNNNQEAEELDEEMAAVVLAEGPPLVTLSAEGAVICMDGVLDHCRPRRHGPIALAPLLVELTGLDTAAPGDVADKGLRVILGLYAFDAHVRMHQLDCAVVLTQLLALPAPCQGCSEHGDNDDGVDFGRGPLRGLDRGSYRTTHDVGGRAAQALAVVAGEPRRTGGLPRAAEHNHRGGHQNGQPARGRKGGQLRNVGGRTGPEVLPRQRAGPARTAQRDGRPAAVHSDDCHSLEAVLAACARCGNRQQQPGRGRAAGRVTKITCYGSENWEKLGEKVPGKGVSESTCDGNGNRNELPFITCLRVFSKS